VAAAKNAMSEDAHDTVRKKVEALFTELAGERARMLDGSLFPAGITSTITASLSGPAASEEQVLQADTLRSTSPTGMRTQRLSSRCTSTRNDSRQKRLRQHVIAAARLAGHPVEASLRENDTGP